MAVFQQSFVYRCRHVNVLWFSWVRKCYSPFDFFRPFKNNENCSQLTGCTKSGRQDSFLLRAAVGHPQLRGWVCRYLNHVRQNTFLHWVLKADSHTPPHRKARSVAQKQRYGWSVTGRLKLEGEKLGKASELSGCDFQSQGPTTRPQSQREEPSLLPKWKSEKPWAILTGKGPRVQMFSPSSQETLATHHMSGVTTEEQGAETPQGRVTYPGSFGSTLRCSSPAHLPCITVLELSPCRANPVCHQQTASVLARAKCRVQHGKGAPWTWTDYSMEMKPVSFQKTVLPIEGLSPRKGLDFYIVKSLLPSPGLICILYLNTKISHNKTASSIQAFSR